MASEQGAAGGTEAEAEAGAGPSARTVQVRYGVRLHGWADEDFSCVDPPPAGSLSPDSPLFPPPPEGETYVGWYGGHRGPGGNGNKLPHKFAVPCPWASACGSNCGAGPRCVVARTHGQAVGQTVPVLDMGPVLGPLVKRHLASLPEGPEREQDRARLFTEDGGVRSVEEVADGDLARILPKVTWRFVREVLPTKTGLRSVLQTHLTRFHFGHLPPQLRTEQGTRLGTEDRNRLPWQPDTAPDADVLAARAAGLEEESYYQQVSIGLAPGAGEEAPDAGAAAGRPAKRQRTATADQPAADSAAKGAGPSGQARGGGGGAPPAAAAGVAMTAEGGGPASAGQFAQTAGPLQLSPADVLLYLLTADSAARKRLSPPPMAGVDGAAGAAQVPWVLGCQPTGEELPAPPLPAWSEPAQNPPTPDEGFVLRPRDPRKRGWIACADPSPPAAADAAAMAAPGPSALAGPLQLTGPGPPGEGLASGEYGAHSAHGSISGDAGLSVVHASSAPLSTPVVCVPPDVGGLSAITPGTAPTSCPAARRPGGPAIPNMPRSFEDWAAAAQAAASAAPQRLGVPGALRQAAAAAAGAAAEAAAEAAAAVAGLGPSPPAPSAASQRPSQGPRPHGLTAAGAALLQQMRRTAEAVSRSAPPSASGPLRAEGTSPSCAGQIPAHTAAEPGPASAQPLAASASALAFARAVAGEVPVTSRGCTAEQLRQPAPIRDPDAVLAAAGHGGPRGACTPGPSTGPAGAAAGPGAAHALASDGLQGGLNGDAVPSGHGAGSVLASTSDSPSPTLWEGHVDVEAQPAAVRARSVAAAAADDTNAERPQRDAAEAEAGAASALDLRLQPARAAAAEVRQRRVEEAAAARERGAQAARQHAEALSKERWRREAAEAAAAAQRWESEATASTLATPETAPAAGALASAQACASGLKGKLAVAEAETRNEAAGPAAAEGSLAAAMKRTAALEGQLAVAEAAAAAERRPAADAGDVTQRELQKARADAAAAEAAVATVSRAAAVAGIASQRAVQQARAEVAAAENAAAAERRAAAESRAFAQRELQKARAEVAEERQRSVAMQTAVREQAEEEARWHAAALAAAQGALERERQARAAAEQQLAAAQEAAQAAAAASREREEQARRELAAAQAARAALEQQLANVRAQGEQRQALYARAMRLMTAAAGVGQGDAASGAGGEG